LGEGGGLTCFACYFGINTYQFANNVKNIYNIELIKPHTNIVSFMLS
jgi:hypothetical protein